MALSSAIGSRGRGRWGRCSSGEFILALRAPGGAGFYIVEIAADDSDKVVETWTFRSREWFDPGHSAPD
jgi:hypothetical protein